MLVSPEKVKISGLAILSYKHCYLILISVFVLSANKIKVRTTISN